jgi:hypothetical protein
MRRVVVICALVAVTTACDGALGGRESTSETVPGQPETVAGTIEGAVSMVTNSGAMRSEAGDTVYLLRDSPTLHTMIADICARYAAQLAQLDREHVAGLEAERAADRAPDRNGDVRPVNSDLSALRAARAELALMINGVLQEVLARYEVARTRTGANGRYRFARVIPGNYRLYAVRKVGDYPYTWWAGLEVVRGGGAVKNLDAPVETLQEGPGAGLCGPLPRPAPKAPDQPEAPETTSAGAS